MYLAKLQNLFAADAAKIFVHNCKSTGVGEEEQQPGQQGHGGEDGAGGGG